MKKILYTVCSANHLAHCKTMIDSFVENNEGYEVIIGLVDKINGRFDAYEWKPYQIVEVHTMGIAGFDKMAAQYTVIELNCAMKVFVAQFIFRNYDPDTVFYLDSDMWVKHNFAVLEKELVNHDILLTPHFNNPFPDNTAKPLERDLLRSGIYNAGFMAFAKSDTTTYFLDWWASHMQDECYYNFAEGMGVDQIWLNLVPLLFKRIGIITHPGANVAYWNLHERDLTNENGTVMVNKKEPLLFLHISGYSFDRPEILSRHQTRYRLADLQVLSELFEQYRDLVVQNGYEKYHALPCAFAKSVKKSTGLMKTVNKLLAPFGVKISNTQN